MLWWINLFHIIFVVMWFTTIYGLTTSFIKYTQTDDETLSVGFKVGGGRRREYFLFATPCGAVGLATGLWLLYGYAGPWNWMIYKLILGFAYVVYHMLCWHHLENFKADRNKRSHHYFRRFRLLGIAFWAGILPLAVPGLWGY